MQGLPMFHFNEVSYPIKDLGVPIACGATRDSLVIFVAVMYKGSTSQWRTVLFSE